MKIDWTSPMTAWSETAAAEQPLRKEHSSRATETRTDPDGPARSPLVSRESSPFNGTYSPASLKAAAARNALLPDVAECNLQASHHVSPIPRLILDQLNQAFSQK
jgi:hypothetical protein